MPEACAVKHAWVGKAQMEGLISYEVCTVSRLLCVIAHMEHVYRMLGEMDKLVCS